MRKNKSVIFLAAAFVVYSLVLLLSKTASAQSDRMCFILFYGSSLICLAVYAVLWQWALKEIPLNLAYPLKAVTLIISMIFGVIFFHEVITLPMIIGTVCIIAGVFFIGGAQ